MVPSRRARLTFTVGLQVWITIFPELNAADQIRTRRSLTGPIQALFICNSLETKTLPWLSHNNTITITIGSDSVQMIVSSASRG